VQLTFNQPANLWFLLAIPVLILAHYFFLRYAKRRALLSPNFQALKRVTGQRIVTRNYLLLTLRMVITPPRHPRRLRRDALV